MSDVGQITDHAYTAHSDIGRPQYFLGNGARLCDKCHRTESSHKFSESPELRPTNPVDQSKNPFCICGKKNAVCPVHEFEKFVGKPVDGEQFTCPVDNSEHTIGHNAVDSGHGARPMGPQICLKCKKTLQELVATHLQAAVREALDHQQKLRHAVNVGHYNSKCGNCGKSLVAGDENKVNCSTCGFYMSYFTTEYLDEVELCKEVWPSLEYLPMYLGLQQLNQGKKQS